jgi:hypothetical protein
MRLYQTNTEKVCTKCHIAKPLDDFYFDSCRGKHLPHCKNCVKEYRREFLKKNPEIRKERVLRKKLYDQNRYNPKSEYFRKIEKKYGITKELYEEILYTQNYRCAICGMCQSELPKRLAMDHNHETNQVRGLLCDKCNKMLGHARENISILQAAIDYLNKENK